MSDPVRPSGAVPIRRAPPPFLRMTVTRVARLSPWMVRITFAGDQLKGFTVEEPAASIRLLLPTAGAEEPVLPSFDRNMFVLPDGTRPIVRTFTPHRVGPEAGALTLDIVIHEAGAASEWAKVAQPGDAAAVSGPLKGYRIDPEAPALLLAGDESAIPAIGQLLEDIPTDISVEAHVEVTHPDARIELPRHPRATVEWHDLPEGAPPGETFVPAVRAAEFPAGTRIWVAGEAAAVQRVRRHLFEERKIPRPETTVRGYWKHGRSGDADDD